MSSTFRKTYIVDPEQSVRTSSSQEQPEHTSPLYTLVANWYGDLYDPSSLNMQFSVTSKKQEQNRVHSKTTGGSYLYWNGHWIFFNGHKPFRKSHSLINFALVVIFYNLSFAHSVLQDKLLREILGLIQSLPVVYSTQSASLAWYLWFQYVCPCHDTTPFCGKSSKNINTQVVYNISLNKCVLSILLIFRNLIV